MSLLDTNMTSVNASYITQTWRLLELETEDLARVFEELTKELKITGVT